MSNLITKTAFAIAGATVLGLASLGFAASASAAPNTTEGTKSCYIDATGPGGPISFGYAAGSEIVVTNPNGTKTKYRCDGNTGLWVEVPAITSGGTVSGTFDGRLISFKTTATRFTTTTATSTSTFTSATTTTRR